MPPKSLTVVATSGTSPRYGSVRDALLDAVPLLVEMICAAEQRSVVQHGETQSHLQDTPAPATVREGVRNAL